MRHVHLCSREKYAVDHALCKTKSAFWLQSLLLVLVFFFSSLFLARLCPTDFHYAGRNDTVWTPEDKRKIVLMGPGILHLVKLSLGLDI